mmetsp:Transcript_20676/g.28890  ORF Transcript_20676/g.28890 Transcript_20676/m.28890 type:complete len:529 (-) Transcript_20676:181-1767(-)
MNQGQDTATSQLSRRALRATLILLVISAPVLRVGNAYLYRRERKKPGDHEDNSTSVSVCDHSLSLPIHKKVFTKSSAPAYAGTQSCREFHNNSLFVQRGEGEAKGKMASKNAAVGQREPGIPTAISLASSSAALLEAKVTSKASKQGANVTLVVLEDGLPRQGKGLSVRPCSEQKTQDYVLCRPLICKYCPRRFRWRTSFRHHMHTHTGERPSKCTRCNKTFTQVSARNVHMKAVHDPSPRPYNCSLCQKSFYCRSNLRTHVKIHRNQCMLCNRKFRTQDAFAKHANVCQEALNRGQPLGNQSSRRTRRPSRPLQSAVAGTMKEASNKKETPVIVVRGTPGIHALARQFAKPSNIPSQKLYPCPFCPRTLTRPHSFVVHYQTHLGISQYHCSLCNDTFIQRASADIHLARKHLHSLPFQCRNCSRRFASVGNLNQHRLTHEGDRRFRCLNCTKRFTQKSNLQVHLLTHIDARPFQCLKCGVGFRAKRTLDFHMGKYHPPLKLELELLSTTGCNVTAVHGPRRLLKVGR